MNLLAEATADSALNEKCVVSQFVTKNSQLSRLREVVKKYTDGKIPVEWVVDVADEHGGWFVGTAYHYDDTSDQVHVMIPDNINPTFDGYFPLDHRAIRLIECVDKHSEALFNKIVRDSVIKIKWVVQWADFDPDGNVPESNQWTESNASYYIKMINQLLVEEDNGNNNYVLLVADDNIRLLSCLKGLGQDEFDRLVIEQIVSSPEDVFQECKQRNERPSPRKSQNTPNSPKANAGSGDVIGHHSIRRVYRLSSRTRLDLDDFLHERDRNKKLLATTSKLFKEYAFEGDLNAGMKLQDKMEAYLIEDKRRRNYPEDETNVTDNLNDSLHAFDDVLHKFIQLDDADPRKSLKKDIEDLEKEKLELQMEVKKREDEIKKLSRGR